MDPNATLAVGCLTARNGGAGGGAWARSAGLVCARALSLISVHDPGLPGVGDMMVDGVIPLGEALRPARSIRGPSPRTWRQERARSRPRRHLVDGGLRAHR